MIFTPSVFAATMSATYSMANPIYFDLVNDSSEINGRVAAKISTLNINVDGTYEEPLYLKLTQNTSGSTSVKVTLPRTSTLPETVFNGCPVCYLVYLDDVYVTTGHLWHSANDYRDLGVNLVGKTNANVRLDFYVYTYWGNDRFTQDPLRKAIISNLPSIGINLYSAEPTQGGQGGNVVTEPVEIGNTDDAVPVFDSSVETSTGEIGSVPYGEQPNLSVNIVDYGVLLIPNTSVDAGRITFVATKFPPDGSKTLTAVITFSGDFALKLMRNGNIVNPEVTIAYNLYYDGTLVTDGTSFSPTYSQNTTTEKNITAILTETNLASKPAGTYLDTITVSVNII